MPKRFDLLQAFLSIMSFTLVSIVVVFVYLLFGDSIMESINNQPQVMVKRAYRPGSGGGGAADEIDYDAVVDGVHVQSGLIVAEGFDIVRGTCTACHSAKLVTPNRATRDGWEEMIRWMQAKQGLGDLGTNEPIILNYLAANYAPEEIGRRANLDVDAIKWYVLDLDTE